MSQLPPVLPQSLPADVPWASQPQSLSYATTGSDDLMRVYRLMGWSFMLMSIVEIIGAGTSFAMMRQGGMTTPGVIGALLAGTSLEVILMAGAFGMIRGRQWGVWAVIASRVLRVLVVTGFAVWQLKSLPWSYAWTVVLSYCSDGTNPLSELAECFLPYVIWQLCRRRGVFANG